MTTPQFTTIQVPARIAELGFSFSKPVDFMDVPLPAEEPTFDKPEYCYPLHVAMAGYGAVVFAVATRPAFEEGSVLDWTKWLLEQQGVTLEGFMPIEINGMPAMSYRATQETEAGQMRLKAAAIEDGGRLILVSVMAPQAIWPSVESTLETMLASFKLDNPRGTKTPLIPGGPVPKSTSKAAAAPTPAPTIAPAPDPKAAAAPQAAAPAPDEPSQAAELALSDTPATLDNDHPINANLRDRGIGLVPRILKIDQASKSAILGAGAIEATFRIPFGWHVIDDGKRTLVLDPENKIQVNLNLRQWEGSADDLLTTILQQNLAEQPNLEHMRLDLGPIRCLGLRNYVSNGEKLEQAFLAQPSHRPGMQLVARVTSTPDDMTRAMNLAEVILRDLRPVAAAVA
ncbi:MAG: hypothetical protein ACREJO_09880 [Phycisphaerales bacterium]